MGQPMSFLSPEIPPHLQLLTDGGSDTRAAQAGQIARGG